MPHTQKPTCVPVAEGTTVTEVTDLPDSCLFADSASVCLLFPVHGCSGLALPITSMSGSIFIFQSLFSFSSCSYILSVNQDTGYFINLSFQFFSRAYILLWICLIKWPAFAGGPVNFSRHCLTLDLSSNIKQKQETEYRVWILFTKPRAGFSPGNVMTLHCPFCHLDLQSGSARRNSEWSSPASRGLVMAQSLKADPASGSKSWTGLITQQAAC